MSENLNNPSRTRVGLIGAGSIARGAHLPGFLANSDVQVVAVADPVEGRATELANEASIELAFTDFRELLNREDIDAVSIATPPVAHAETTIAALEAGKHVFCEKPMAMNSVEAIAMEQAALKANPELELSIRADTDAPFGMIIRVMDAAKAADITSVKAYTRVTNDK